MPSQSTDRSVRPAGAGSVIMSRVFIAGGSGAVGRQLIPPTLSPPVVRWRYGLGLQPQ
jgi:hypothetical protein